MPKPEMSVEISGQCLVLDGAQLADILWSMRICADTSRPLPRPLIERLQDIAEFICEGAASRVPEYQRSTSAVPSPAQRALSELRADGTRLRVMTEALLFACAQTGYADCAPETITNFDVLSQIVQAPRGYHAQALIDIHDVLLETELQLKSFLVHAAFLGITEGSGSHAPGTVEVILQKLSADMQGNAERIMFGLKLLAD
ncbi:MAG TPA: hypothetical protein PLP17_17730, partial [Oligoflexia bacterium]|nr:hypothetical protein [Oligoflexia bacterium]